MRREPPYDTLQDARVLITGGTGTFGRRMVRELLRMPEGPAAVVVLSRDELKQSEMQHELHGDPRMRYFLGDVRDRARLEHAFRGVDVVIHAAALKQVPAAEYNPTEVVRTNVQGAMNVVDAAISAGVKKVVALSTDKACEPINLYGATKAVAEKIFLAAGNLVGALGTPTFAVTRYGNVTGSRGSVLEIWRRAIAETKTIRPQLAVTHPGCTRFWMTPAEAVELVLWTIARMEGGETVVPDLPAYRVHDLAAAVAAESGKLIEFKVTGMRPGEKMHETMISVHDRQEYVREGGYFVRDPHHPRTPQDPGAIASDTATRMGVEQLHRAIVDLQREDA